MRSYTLWVLGILLVALAIRYNGAQLSVFNDETGSYTRTQVASLDALMHDKIAKSVHPGGFFIAYYYWQGLVGDAVLAHKSLSILFNLIALVLAFAITRRVFGEWQALLVLILLSCLEFNAYQAQNIRPYAMGQMTVLWAVWHLESLRLRRGKRWGHLIGMSLALALSAYAHYFAALSAALVFGCFTLRLPRPLRWWVMGMAAVPVLLFSPHLVITISHLKRGGLSWLPPPDLHFIANYFSHLAHHSWWLGLSLLALLVWGWLVRPKGGVRVKDSLPYGLSFLGVFAIGFLYSHWKAPVLQYSGLYFTAPLLLMGAFGALPLARWRWRQPTIVLVAVLCIGTLYLERNYHRVMARSANSGWIKATQEALASAPERRTLVLCSSNRRAGIEFAMRGVGADFDFAIQPIRTLDSIPLILPLLDTAQYDRVILNLARYEIPEYPAIVQGYFEDIEAIELGVQYAHYVFRKGQRNTSQQLELVADSVEFARYEDLNITAIPAHYFPMYSARYRRLQPGDASVVQSAHAESGEQLLWRGVPLALFDGGDTAHYHTAAVGFPNSAPRLHHYTGGVWNPGQARLTLTQTGFSFWPHNFYWPGLNQAVHGKRPYPWRPMAD